MQVLNECRYVRSVQLPVVDPTTKETTVASFTIEPGATAHIPDVIWRALEKLDDDPQKPRRLWGLRAAPDEKLSTTKHKASEAIAMVIKCSDPTAIESALNNEKRASVIAALQVRAEELGSEASN